MRGRAGDAALQILPRHMRMQHAEFAFFGCEIERDVVRVKAARAVSNQRAERVLRNKRMQLVCASFGEIGR